MKPFAAPNRPPSVKPFAPLTHQPRSVIDAGLVYWGSHKSEPQNAQKTSNTTTWLVLVYWGFGHSPNTSQSHATVLEDEVDDTYHIHTYRQTNKQTDTYIQTHRQKDRQTDTNRKTGRQTDRHLDRKADQQT